MVLTDWALQILAWLACQTSSHMRISTTWMCVFTRAYGHLIYNLEADVDVNSRSSSLALWLVCLFWLWDVRCLKVLHINGSNALLSKHQRQSPDDSQTLPRHEPRVWLALVKLKHLSKSSLIQVYLQSLHSQLRLWLHQQLLILRSVLCRVTDTCSHHPCA